MQLGRWRRREDSVSYPRIYPHAAWLGLSILYSGKHGYTDIFQEEGKHDLYGMQENVDNAYYSTRLWHLNT